ncbi:hypothetical protein HV782_017635 [Pseudomonas monsensis]|uniref:hypothetical protein n=1 Tax=Pseudomonas monsensis TaxID=2745509 RepID=UPI001644DAC9|nr:hypothetical protein [Pseudomonas monsensis]QXH98387.1 hypothetical protein HV782_017635 [Pseudomonas monsensis]
MAQAIALQRKHQGYAGLPRNRFADNGKVVMKRLGYRVDIVYRQLPNGLAHVDLCKASGADNARFLLCGCLEKSSMAKV